MSGLASFRDDSVRPEAPAPPDTYTLRLSKDVYQHFDGSPPDFFLRELGAQMLFSRIGRFAGIRAMTFKPINELGGIVGRCCSYNPIRMHVKGGDDCILALSETAFILPGDGGYRGIVPVVDTHDMRGTLVSRKPRELIQCMDRLVWGPFVSFQYDEPFQENAEKLRHMVRSSDQPEVRVYLDPYREDQEKYFQLLSAIVGRFGIAAPELAPIEYTDFVVPPYFVEQHPN